MMRAATDMTYRLALMLAVGVLAACSAEKDPGPRLLVVCADTVRADIFHSEDIGDAFSPWLEKSCAIPMP